MNTSTKLGVLDFGTSKTGKLAAERLRSGLRSAADIHLLDPDLSIVAARGVGYSGSLNLSLAEARDLGSAMDAEFYVLGDAQTLRRSSSSKPSYFESYSSIFLVSARTGRLVWWSRVSFEADKPDDAEHKMLGALPASDIVERLLAAMHKSQLDERNERALLPDTSAPLIEEAPDDETTAAARGLRLPRPYQRMRPIYPESAARAEVEAIVDVLVDVRADGEVGGVEVTRWAGFGLDETTLTTVKQMHFFPAMRDGNPVAMRVLLRYNFRKSSQ